MLYWEYIQSVISDQIPVGRYIRLAVQRHLDDLERSGSGDWPYYFNERVVEYQYRILKTFVHTQDVFQGKPFNVQPWQAFVNAQKWGWLKKDNNYRRFRRSYLEVPRKNGKSEMGAADMVYALCFEGVPQGGGQMLFNGAAGGEVYSVAVEKQQAYKSYDAAVYMIEALRASSPILARRVQEPTIWGVRTETGSRMRVISRDKKGSMDSLNTSYCNVDELHAHGDGGNTLNSAEQSTGARPQSMVSCISTAGYDKHGICFETRRYGIDILEKRKTDDAQAVFIWTVDEDVEWSDPRAWRMANPNWGISLFPDEFEQAYIKASQKGIRHEIDFKVKRLNIWVDSVTGWFPTKYLEAAHRPDITLDLLKGRRCYAGLDLARTRDLSALSLFFPSDNGDPHVTLQYYFIPEEDLRERSDRDHVNYEEWLRGGHVTVTPGNVTDFAYIEKFIENISAIVDIIHIGYDMTFATQAIINLTDAGFNMREKSFRAFRLSTATSEIENLFRTGQIVNSGNPITDWCYRNVTLRVGAQDGAIMPDKARSRDKIDGAVADIMAYDTYRKAEIEPAQNSGVGLDIRDD